MSIDQYKLVYVNGLFKTNLLLSSVRWFYEEHLISCSAQPKCLLSLKDDIFQFSKTWWEIKSPRNSEFPQVIDMAIPYLQLIFPLQTYPQHPLYIKSISIGIIKMTSYFINHKSFCRGGYYCNCFSIEIKNSSFSFTTHVNTVVCLSPKTILHVANQEMKGKTTHL